MAPPRPADAVAGEFANLFSHFARSTGTGRAAPIPCSARGPFHGCPTLDWDGPPLPRADSRTGTIAAIRRPDGDRLTTLPDLTYSIAAASGSPKDAPLVRSVCLILRPR